MGPLTPSKPPTPAPWRWIDGIVYGENGDGDIVAIEVPLRDGPLVEAAPEMYEALRGVLCRACGYRFAEPREGPICVVCERPRAALAKAEGREP